VLAARGEGGRSLADHGRHVRHRAAKKDGLEVAGPTPSTLLRVRGKGRRIGHVLAQLAAPLKFRVGVAELGIWPVAFEDDLSLPRGLPRSTRCCCSGDAAA
jgi:hypothetical protein